MTKPQECQPSDPGAGFSKTALISARICARKRRQVLPMAGTAVAVANSRMVPLPDLRRLSRWQSGPLADAKGRVLIQIRDLDQTVIGNPAHDLIRLGLSLASASRGSDLPGVTTAKILEELVAGYQSALSGSFETDRDKVLQAQVHSDFTGAINPSKTATLSSAEERLDSAPSPLSRWESGSGC